MTSESTRCIVSVPSVMWSMDEFPVIMSQPWQWLFSFCFLYGLWGRTDALLGFDICSGPSDAACRRHQSTTCVQHHMSLARAVIKHFQSVYVALFMT
jgi:hypothetical protein